ncbi:NADP-dependent l-serine/l-allo-threonine dehydrogenase ydfg [Campylobacter sputorum subsp. bubulus]|uniref:NADP-dependent l-serine/l-allo-threonine dehydrogenase ydfg n=1 Tax=Campylobacter sputorum subsp. sputorum TaxID=32024 RepID=A0A381DI09_9BACT|nr:SDR family NAD(P)-dependent oxidoreductase [Campylobacter sputorum]ASM35377.1 short-chain dehydrogenase/reductase, subgroup 5 [Campylobacter sputorum aubsp. sputorum RM3237]KAB0582879.1 SDR family NAD(P)-dependent oxidoreductase [Campylobacter sputorum subsp. sputorum]QEL05569.1 short-chain dehydrogenase/reductase, subgroup 5 [Campylobacter sputorum subsp. sputorum]SUX08610.1 NADP-dependent l-serine/l-allo-threonine dehydrogenase ydfg [Campylobacter sputorum subsp. bubulus]SUX10334.1 NADP-d
MNKTAFITGATSGFGEAIARLLAKNGYKLVLVARREDRLKTLSDEIGKDNVHIISLDICDKDSVFKAIKDIPQNFLDIEILVNNAGLALGQESFIDASIEDFETMIDTNIKGLIYITKAILPIMKQRKSGYIFNLGSVAGNWPYSGGNVYGATKAFVKQLSFNLRNDLKGTNIRVTNIEPGIAKTEFSLVRFKGDKSKADSVYENTGFLRAEDIATIVLNCINMPKNVNINSLEVMATTQTWAGFFFEKK